MNENSFSFVNIVRSGRSPLFDGVRSIANLSGSAPSPIKVYETGEKADAAALHADWQAIGEDMRKAIEYEKEHV